MVIMEDATKKLIEYVLTKLENESVAERVKFYNILAEFFPNEEASIRLQKYTEELQRIDFEFQRIKSLFFLTNKNE
jgi:Trp operon repressor